MLTTTLKKGLDAYAIGATVKALRTKKQIGLVELGRHTGLSAAMLSKIERGRLFPTLPTLLRIALVFGVGLDYFFAGVRKEPAGAVVRRRDRLRFPDRQGTREPAFYSSRSTMPPLNAASTPFAPSSLRLWASFGCTRTPAASSSTCSADR